MKSFIWEILEFFSLEKAPGRTSSSLLVLERALQEICRGTFHKGLYRQDKG